MKLCEFPCNDVIFVDANIFTYFALGTPRFQDTCAAFLSRIESRQIQAVTSDFVLNEVFYAVLVGKASELLQSTRIKFIQKRLLADSELSNTCYQACLKFWDYLEILQDAGLNLIRVDRETQHLSLNLGRQHLLLPTDALHLAVCQR